MGGSCYLSTTRPVSAQPAVTSVLPVSPRRLSLRCLPFPKQEESLGSLRAHGYLLLLISEPAVRSGPQSARSCPQSMCYAPESDEGACPGNWPQQDGQLRVVWRPGPAPCSTLPFPPQTGVSNSHRATLHTACENFLGPGPIF